MSFQDHAKLLFALLQAKALRDFSHQKNIHISLDRVNKNFILHTKIFSENRYVSPRMKDFIQQKKFASGSFLCVCEKTASVHIRMHVPFEKGHISWRKLFIDFAEQAHNSITELHKIAEQDCLSF
jgi:hypothetical protein